MSLDDHGDALGPLGIHTQSGAHLTHELRSELLMTMKGHASGLVERSSLNLSYVVKKDGPAKIGVGSRALKDLKGVGPQILVMDGTALVEVDDGVDLGEESLQGAVVQESLQTQERLRREQDGVDGLHEAR